MAEHLKLEMLIGGLDMLQVIDRAADEVGKLADMYDRLMKGQRHTADALESATDSVDRQKEAVERAIGPWTKLAQAQKQYREETEKGDPERIKDAAFRLKQANEAVNRAQRQPVAPGAPSRKSPIADLLGTSRFDISVGKLHMMPLINRAMKVGGMDPGAIDSLLEKIPLLSDPKKMGGLFYKSPPPVPPSFDIGLGPIGGGGGGGAAGTAMMVVGRLTLLAAAVSVAAKAIEGLGNATMRAKDVYSELGAARFASGGSFGQMTGLAGLGQAFGKSPAAMAAEARAFGQSTMSNAFAMSYAAELGINPLGGPFGDVNYAAKLSKAYAGLSDPSRYSDVEAFRRAEALGLDSMQVGLLRNASPGVRASILSQHMSGTPEDTRRAADAQLLYNSQMAKSNVLVAEIGAKLLPIANAGLTAFNRALGLMSFGVQTLDAVLGASKLFDLAGSVLPNLPVVGGMFGGGGGGGRANVAIDENTRAQKELTNAITDLTGAIGYGSKGFRGNLPQGVTRYENAVAILRGQAAALGAISI